MITIKEEEFLHCDKKDTFVVKIKEYYLFNFWCFRKEELHSYNQALINAFTIQKEPKKAKQIGFKSNNKQSKKKKTNENKSKIN